LRGVRHGLFQLFLLFLLPVAWIGLAPLPHAPDIFRPAKVVATEGRAPPSALAGLFAGALASGFAAVMLAVLVAVIREEKLAATAALTSLRPQTHRWSKRPRCGRKEKQRPGREEEPARKKEEAFSGEVAEEDPPKENTISNRRD
jgi:hypothetical protein